MANITLTQQELDELITMVEDLRAKEREAWGEVMDEDDIGFNVMDMMAMRIKTANEESPSCLQALQHVDMDDYNQLLSNLVFSPHLGVFADVATIIP